MLLGMGAGQNSLHFKTPPLVHPSPVGSRACPQGTQYYKENFINKEFFLSREHCSLHTILRKSLLSPVFLAVSPFLGTGEYEESLGLIDFLCFVCNVWHPLQFLVSYCTADPRGFSVYLRNLEVAGKKSEK